MAKEWAKPFYNSKQWKQCRKSYIAHRISIDGGMCEHCHRELGYIDHITELQDLGRMPRSLLMGATGQSKRPVHNSQVSDYTVGYT